jgi:hypothetical protein
VGQLVALGALQQQQQQQQQPGEAGEVLTPLGSHLTAMPMDAALGKALLYGCMLRWVVVVVVMGRRGVLQLLPGETHGSFVAFACPAPGSCWPVMELQLLGAESTYKLTR